MNIPVFLYTESIENRGLSIAEICDNVETLRIGKYQVFIRGSRRLVIDDELTRRASEKSRLEQISFRANTAAQLETRTQEQIAEDWLL